MEKNKSLKLLFDYASEYRFVEFNHLFSELEREYLPAELTDAYLMRAQIKLLVMDESLMNDLEMAGENESAPGFPCLFDCWPYDGPTRLMMFYYGSDSVRAFAAILPRVKSLLSLWYGKSGGNMALQLQSDISYYLGCFDEAIRLAAEQDHTGEENRINAMLAECVLFRSYLARGNVSAAEAHMVKMIHMSRLHPECLDTYQAIRQWANFTTGWSGDVPRFYADNNGKRLPVLSDRLEAIRNGISRLRPTEEYFLSFAGRKHREILAMRNYYMDVFHSVYWFYMGDYQQLEASFIRAYDIASKTGLIMPFVEYGRQIIPLLQHIKSRAEGIVSSKLTDWLDDMIARAEEYEKGLSIYRSLNG